MNVLVYSGEGASQDSVDYTIYTLKQFISENYDIIKVDDKILITQYWEDSTKLLVIPGGRDLPYVNKLGSKGMERIRKYVNDRGGKYLGIGAGAYFGASNIEFEMNRPDYKVEGQRELKFFNGTAKGSAMNPFYYDSEESALSPKIHLPLLNKDVNLYLNGGCFFDINEKEKVSNELNILGTYTTKCFDGTDNRPAIIEVKNGKGKAILSGVHFEYSPELMIEKKKKAQEEGKDISNLEKVIEDIEKTNMDRIEFIKSIFERLDLKLNKDIKNSITEEKNNYHLLLIGMEGQSNKKFIDNILESDINENSLNENYFSFKENVEEKDKEVIYINKFENENQLKNFKYFNVKYYLEKLKNNYCNYNENELNEKYLPGSITLYSEILSSTQTILKKYIFNIHILIIFILKKKKKSFLFFLKKIFF